MEERTGEYRCWGVFVGVIPGVDVGILFSFFFGVRVEPDIFDVDGTGENTGVGTCHMCGQVFQEVCAV